MIFFSVLGLESYYNTVGPLLDTQTKQVISSYLDNEKIYVCGEWEGYEGVWDRNSDQTPWWILWNLMALRLWEQIFTKFL